MALYPELLEELGGHLGEVLARSGMDPEKASAMAFACVEFVRREWGGRTIYVPQAEGVEMAARNQELYARWRALWTIPQLAKEYDLSEMRIRQILHQVRVARRQPAQDSGLFPGFSEA